MPVTKQKTPFLFMLANIIGIYGIFMSTAFADEDLYYKNNPGCVIDRGNPERTGVYNEKIPDHPKILWQTAAASLHTPICAGNLLIMNPLVAFDYANGKKIWDVSANTGDHNYQPTYYKGVIYWDKMFSSEKQRKKSVNLMKYDATTGKLFYQKSFGIDSSVGPLIYNNIAYISLYDGLTAYDLKTKKIFWKIGTTADLEGISTDGKILFLTVSNGGIHAFDIQNGKLLWKDDSLFETGYVTIGDDAIYVNFLPFFEDRKEGIIAYKKRTGKVIWKRYFGDVPGFNKEGSLSNITFHKDKLFFSNIVETPIIPITEPTRYSPAGGSVYALDARTGKLLWHKEIAPFTAPICINNILYVGGQNVLYALDEKTGEEHWHLNVKDDVINLVPYQNKLFLKLSMMKNEKLVSLG